MKKLKNLSVLITCAFLSIVSCSKDDEPQSSPAQFSVSPNSLDFGELKIGLEMGAEVTITNTGQQDLILESFSLSGDNSSEFKFIAYEDEVTIQAGESFETLISFIPIEEGDKMAILKITSNIGEHEINLSGTAVINPDAIVNIPDANFKASLLAHGDSITGDGISVIDTNNDGEIQIGEAQTYDGTIICYNSSISDLTGIEAFINLTRLNFANNQLTSLDVSQNTALEYLVCDNNQLTSLDVSNNTNLKTFWAQNNQLTSIDISQNTALETLYLAHNELTHVDVSGNTELRTISVSTNQISNIDVSNNTQLIRLLVQDNNSISSLDVSQNIYLRELYCHNNAITSLDVSNNTALEDLYCDNNGLSNLDVSQNSALKELRCSYNQLTNLDISNNTSLELLNCGYNQLTSLDVSQNIALEYFYCYNNQLTSLDVSQNTALNYFYCYENQLVSIDVSNNPLLSLFTCHSNQLTDLNLANGNNKNLTNMSALNNNNLTCIKIDADFTPPNDGSWEKDPTASYSTNCY